MSMQFRSIRALILLSFVTFTLCNSYQAKIEFKRRPFYEGNYPKVRYEANTITKVRVDYSSVTHTTNSIPTLQVVVNPLLRRGSLIHDSTFKALADLQATHVRYVPWTPYPRLAVAELFAPKGNPHCGQVLSGANLLMQCKNGTISSIDFAAYGDNGGRCQSFKTNPTCTNTLTVKQFLLQNCLGKASCLIPASNASFPLRSCSNSQATYTLAAQWKCSYAVNETSWDFSLVDPLMEDFMSAVTKPGTNDTRGAIINWSTSPEWLWATDSEITFPDDPNQPFWTYELGTELLDRSLVDLGNYYERLVRWYTQGGFTDEYGNKVTGGHYYNITFWEVLNEVEGEHGMTPQSYTQRYDAIVTAIQRAAPNMKFVGIALAHYWWTEWYTYFLNRSNHIANVPLEYISFHFYGSCNDGTNPTEYEGFFAQADGFHNVVAQILKIRDQLSPSTKIDTDELGVILNTEVFPTIYWNAVAALDTYQYLTLSMMGIDVIGVSQLVGYPSQFPSVSMMNWTSGQPTPRVWALKLVIQHFDSKTTKMMETYFDASSPIFAQGFISGNDGVPRLVLINKSSNIQTVSVPPSFIESQVECVDEISGFGPARVFSLDGPLLDMQRFAVCFLSQ
eukprot:TRINITY_DN705_c0_g1_i3.p1 TRINITY_DN705_c0_g1~~TRINITY_DN705_c0_g1_i3.p1  ORF type:complete len:620 (+),score=118.64 TRINITY_DN705_c0_g1_i3:46-1905(+)